MREMMLKGLKHSIHAKRQVTVKIYTQRQFVLKASQKKRKVNVKHSRGVPKITRV